MSDDKSICGGGIGIGTVAAGALSWFTHHSVGYTILNAILGWIYVIYWFACTDYSSTIKIP